MTSVANGRNNVSFSAAAAPAPFPPSALKSSKSAASIKHLVSFYEAAYGPAQNKSQQQQQVACRRCPPFFETNEQMSSLVYEKRNEDAAAAAAAAQGRFMRFQLPKQPAAAAPPRQ